MDRNSASNEGNFLSLLGLYLLADTSSESEDNARSCVRISGLEKKNK